MITQEMVDVAVKAIGDIAGGWECEQAEAALTAVYPLIRQQVIEECAAVCDGLEGMFIQKLENGSAFWANIMKYPEMLSCKDPDCMVDYTYTFNGKTVITKILSQEKYMNKYHSDLIAVDNN